MFLGSVAPSSVLPICLSCLSALPISEFFCEFMMELRLVVSGSMLCVLGCKDQHEG